VAADRQKLKEFVNRVVADVGAGMSAALVVLGDRLGLYKAMAGAGPLTPAELASASQIAHYSHFPWRRAVPPVSANCAESAKANRPRSRHLRGPRKASCGCSCGPKVRRKLRTIRQTAAGGFCEFCE
jgi:hypothetical protein